MTVPTRAVLLIFALMSLLHAGVSFMRRSPSIRHLDDEELGKIDYIRFRKGVRNRYVLSRALQAFAEIEGIQAMDRMVRDMDIKKNFKGSDNSRPISTSYLSRLLNKRNADLRVIELAGAEQWPERREGETRNILDGQIEWLYSRVYPWRVDNNDDDSESYFGNHVELIGSSIIG